MHRVKASLTARLSLIAEDWYGPPIDVRENDCVCGVHIDDSPPGRRRRPSTLQVSYFDCCSCAGYLADSLPTLSLAEVRSMRGPKATAIFCVVCRTRVGCSAVVQMGSLCDRCGEALFEAERTTRFAQCMLTRAIGPDLARVILFITCRLPFGLACGSGGSTRGQKKGAGV